MNIIRFIIFLLFYFLTPYLTKAQDTQENNPNTKCYIYTRPNGTIEMLTFQKPKQITNTKVIEFIYYFSSEYENNLIIEVLSFDVENQIYHIKLPISKELCKITKTAAGYLLENFKGNKKIFRRVDF